MLQLRVAALCGAKRGSNWVLHRHDAGSGSRPNRRESPRPAAPASLCCSSSRSRMEFRILVILKRALRSRAMRPTSVLGRETERKARMLVVVSRSTGSASRNCTIWLASSASSVMRKTSSQRPTRIVSPWVSSLRRTGMPFTNVPLWLSRSISWKAESVLLMVKCRRETARSRRQRWLDRIPADGKLIAQQLDQGSLGRSRNHDNPGVQAALSRQRI